MMRKSKKRWIVGIGALLVMMLLGELLWVASKAAMFSLGVLLVVGSFGLVGSWWSLLVPLLGFLGGMIFALLAVNGFAGASAVICYASGRENTRSAVSGTIFSASM